MESEPAPTPAPEEPSLAELPFRPARRRQASEARGAPTRKGYRNALAAGSIVLAAVLAHGGCLQATFYADDWNQIVGNDWVDHGQWWQADQHALTYFTYWLTYACGGMSAAAFHLGNLLLHAATALAVAGFTRNLLVEGTGMPPTRAGRIAWWAGLLFAVHPLCSEVPNYVRTRDVELTSLFAVLAAWATLRWRRQRKPGYRWTVLTLLAVLGATFCKEVGFIVAGGAAALVWFGARRPPDARARRQAALPLATEITRAKTKLVVAPKDASLVQGNWPVTLSLSLVGVCIALLAWPAWQTAVAALQHPRLGWHALTEARVFWMCLERVALPVRLCSDHQIAWTQGWDDPAAWTAAAAEAGVLAGTVFLYFRRQAAARTAGVLLALVMLDFLHRLANPDGETMVESRMYPAMGPLCALIAWGVAELAELAAGGRRQAAGGSGEAGKEGRRAMVGWAIIAGLVAGGTVLSARRAQAWRSTGTLVADIVAQYPLQARARQLVQDEHVRAAYWTEALRAQPAIREALAGAETANANTPARQYRPEQMRLTSVSSEGNCALALARLGREGEALAHMESVRDGLHPGSGTEREYRALFLLKMGLVHEALDRDGEAINELRESVRLGEGNEAGRALRRLEIKKG